MIDFNEINQIPWDNYYKEEYKKNQVCLHLTGGSTLEGVLSYWKTFGPYSENQNNRYFIGVPIVIDENAKINQLWSTKYKGGYHLAVGKPEIEFGCIGVEIVNWGPVVETLPNIFYPKDYINQVTPLTKSQIVTYDKPFRGYNQFHKLSDDKIEAIRKLLLYWNETWDIPLKLKGNIFDYNEAAVNGESGIFTHVSYRKFWDRWDWHPQPELVQMLNSL
jgi:frataxin-like iron-binding protein CyaY